MSEFQYYQGGDIKDYIFKQTYGGYESLWMQLK